MLVSSLNKTRKDRVLLVDSTGHNIERHEEQPIEKAVDV